MGSRPCLHTWTPRIALALLTALTVVLLIFYLSERQQIHGFTSPPGTKVLISLSDASDDNAHALTPGSQATGRDRTIDKTTMEGSKGMPVSAAGMSSSNGMKPTAEDTSDRTDVSSASSITVDLDRIRRYAETLDPELMNHSAPGETLSVHVMQDRFHNVMQEATNKWCH